jgi:DNA-binding GntR family transcriptional regulator
VEHSESAVASIEAIGGQRKLSRTWAYEIVRDAIVTLEFAPGMQMVETRLAEQLEISRAPLREALRELENEGLVESIPFKGTFVAPLAEKDLRDLLFVRKILETAAAEVACSTGSDEDVAKVKEMAGHMWTVGTEHGLEWQVDLDMAFHRSILQMTKSELLLQMWDSLDSRIRRWMIFKDRALSPSLSVEQHMTIANAIAERRAGSAVKAVEEHLKAVVEVLLQKVQRAAQQ